MRVTGPAFLNHIADDSEIRSYDGGLRKITTVLGFALKNALYESRRDVRYVGFFRTTCIASSVETCSVQR